VVEVSEPKKYPDAELYKLSTMFPELKQEHLIRWDNCRGQKYILEAFLLSTPSEDSFSLTMIILRSTNQAYDLRRLLG
jgi:hypothetical protein